MAESDQLVLDHPVPGAASSIVSRRALDHLTTHVGLPETDAAPIHVTLAEHSIRFDRLDTRMTRIENRLDLVEG
jgi:hypothetical protein